MLGPGFQQNAVTFDPGLSAILQRKGWAYEPVPCQGGGLIPWEGV